MRNNDPDSIEARLGRRVKCRREELDIDIAKLSKKSGILLSRIVNFEAGLGILDVAEIQQLSSALSMPISLLFEDSSNEQRTYKFVSPKDGLALNYAFLRVENEQVRSEIIALVQTLSNEDNRFSPQKMNKIRDKIIAFRQSLSD